MRLMTFVRRSEVPFNALRRGSVFPLRRRAAERELLHSNVSLSTLRRPSRPPYRSAPAAPCGSRPSFRVQPRAD